MSTPLVLSDFESLSRSLSCLLESVGQDKYWVDFQEDWGPIISCLTSQLLMECGLEPETPWYIKRPGYIRCTLQDTFVWLNSQIRDDGTFGTDFWDAARLGVVIEQRNLFFYFPRAVKLRASLLEIVDLQQINSTESIWRGPGFLAAAIDYLDQINASKQAETLSQHLISLQRPEGYWQGVVTPAGHHVISPIWHTAQAVITLARRSGQTHRNQIKEAIEWIKATQERDGCWSAVQQYIIYFTAYALMALRRDTRPDQEAVNSGIDYLKRRMTDDGKCGDLGGTLMCGIALRDLMGEMTAFGLTLTDYALARRSLDRTKLSEELLQEREQECRKLSTELQQLRDKYKDADMVLSKQQILVIVLVSLFLTALGTVVGVFALLSAGIKP